MTAEEKAAVLRRKAERYAANSKIIPPSFCRVTTYEQERMNPLSDTEPVQIVQSPMDTGKTHQLIACAKDPEKFFN